MVMRRDKYFEDSSTSAAYVTYWITRADAAKIIAAYGGRVYDTNNLAEVDKITTLEVFDTIVRGGAR